jgi:hypothetical protein
VTLLAQALPRQVTYFISYVMILALSGFGGVRVFRFVFLSSFLFEKLVFAANWSFDCSNDSKAAGQDEASETKHFPA